MLETSKLLVIIITFATVIQFCVERTKEIVGTKVMQYIKAPIWSLIFGIAFAFLFKLDIFAMFGFVAQVPIVTYLITGLILSSGAAPIHDLISKIRNDQQTK